MKIGKVFGKRGKLGKAGWKSIRGQADRLL